MTSGHITAASLARTHGVSRSTIQRRISEGKFPGAKKVKRDFGEIWIIPRDVAESVSFKEISPKLDQEKHKNSVSLTSTQLENYATLKAKIEAHEGRISTLEQLLVKYFAQQA